MKRWILVLCITLFAAAFLPAQIILTDYQDAFQSFADAAVGSLASTATSGLAWSPAHVGQFPHLGVGLTVGIAMMPYEAVEPVFNMLWPTLPSELNKLPTWGVPLPAAVIDARLGGFGIPFDIGFKIGFIPEQVQALLGDVQADYFIAGGDVRFAILQDKGFVPALSVGVGYSYLKGGVEVAGLLGGPQEIDITDLMINYGGKTGGTHLLQFSDPSLNFEWESHVIEAKVQLSKNLLIFTPHVGFGASWAMKSSVSGGLTSTVTYSDDGSPGILQEVIDAFIAAGKTPPTDQGFFVAADAPAGWALRAFGGTSVNLLFLRLDLDAYYNVLTGAWGGNANLRFEM